MTSEPKAGALLRQIDGQLRRVRSAVAGARDLFHDVADEEPGARGRMGDAAAACTDINAKLDDLLLQVDQMRMTYGRAR
jgi:CDP-diacylglycerol pyrophosphatase